MRLPLSAEASAHWDDSTRRCLAPELLCVYDNDTHCQAVPYGWPRQECPEVLIITVHWLSVLLIENPNREAFDAVLYCAVLRFSFGESSLR